MKTVFIRPTGGRKIRVPERPSQILPEGGMLVPLTDYWQARIETGDVEIASPVPARPPAPPRRTAPKTPTTPQES